MVYCARDYVAAIRNATEHVDEEIFPYNFLHIYYASVTFNNKTLTSKSVLLAAPSVTVIELEHNLSQNSDNRYNSMCE
jgi:hypothetical protein